MYILFYYLNVFFFVLAKKEKRKNKKMSIKKRYFIKKGSFIKRDFFQKNNGRTGVMYTLDKGSLKGISNTALYKTIDSYPTMLVRSNIKDENGNFIKDYAQDSINTLILRGVNQRAKLKAK